MHVLQGHLAEEQPSIPGWVVAVSCQVDLQFMTGSFAPKPAPISFMSAALPTLRRQTDPCKGQATELCNPRRYAAQTGSHPFSDSPPIPPPPPILTHNHRKSQQAGTAGLLTSQGNSAVPCQARLEEIRETVNLLAEKVAETWLHRTDFLDGFVRTSVDLMQ